MTDPTDRALIEGLDSQVELLRAEQVYDLALHAEAEDTGPCTPGFARRAAIRAMMAFIKGPVACNYPAAKPDDDEGLRDALQEIVTWSEAYPLRAFPEPDLEKAAAVLKAAGMTLDAISASNFRHVLDGVSGIARAALAM